MITALTAISPGGLLPAGPQGPQGVQGIQGPQGNAGPIGPAGAQGVPGAAVWQTPPVPWAASTPYLATPPASLVVFNGATYVCTTSHTSTSSFDPSKWQVIVQTSNVFTPLIGGSAASSTLTLESTSGVGTSDYINFLTGSQVERMRIDTSGNVIIGGTTNFNGGNLQINGGGSTIGTNGPYFIMSAFNTNANYPSFDFFYSNTATFGAQAAVPHGNFLGKLRFTGSTGTAQGTAAFICGFADAAWSSGSSPGALSLQTTSPGQTGATERVRIDSTGATLVGLGNSLNYAKLNVSGYDGDPTTAALQNVPFAINGVSNASALTFGIGTSSGGQFPWIQGKNWSGGGTETLLLQPLGGGIVIQSPISGIISGLNGGVQIGADWGIGTSTYIPQQQFTFSQLSIFNVSGTNPGGITVAARDGSAQANSSTQGITSFAFAENSGNTGVWCHYMEGHRLTHLDYAYGIEMAMVNRYNDNTAVTPFGFVSPGGGAATIGLQIDSGNGLPSSDYTYYSSSCAIYIANNSGTGQSSNKGFATGLVIGPGSIDPTLFGGSIGQAIALSASPGNHAIGWWTSTSNVAWMIYCDATSGSNNLHLTNNAAWFSTSVVVGAGGIAPSATDGFLYIPTMAGPPTGVPTSHNGLAALTYDANNDKLWVYYSSVGWKSVQLS